MTRARQLAQIPSHRFARISHKLPSIVINARFCSLTGMGGPDCDSRKLLVEFLGLKTDADFQGFLDGDFDDDLRPMVHGYIAYLREWQRLIHVLSKTPRQKWDAQQVQDGRWKDSALRAKFNFDHKKFERATVHPLTLFPGRKDGDPAEVVSHTKLGAMLDVVHIKKMEGFKERPCALDGCLQTFPVKTGHRQKYCCNGHTTLANTRKWRERLRKKSRKSRKSKT
jgi:hypothetical protein